jgi:hypothetical protein
MVDGKTRRKGKSVLEKRKLKQAKRAARDAERRRRDVVAPVPVN